MKMFAAVQFLTNADFNYLTELTWTVKDMTAKNFVSPFST
jgi:hypothetical protein